MQLRGLEAQFLTNATLTTETAIQNSIVIRDSSVVCVSKPVAKLLAESVNQHFQLETFSFSPSSTSCHSFHLPHPLSIEAVVNKTVSQSRREAVLSCLSFRRECLTCSVSPSQRH